MCFSAFPCGSTALTEDRCNQAPIRWVAPPSAVPLTGYEVELTDTTAGGPPTSFANLTGTDVVLEPLQVSEREHHSTVLQLSASQLSHSAIQIRSLRICVACKLLKTCHAAAELLNTCRRQLDRVYAVRVRAKNIVGYGPWTAPATNVYTFKDGECANDADAAIWNTNQASFSADMATCCGGCLGGRACFVDCWQDLLGYSPACAGCWGDTCACSTVYCLVPCLIGNQIECDACVIENCNPTTEACTGVPGDWIPSG
eukprot:SAG22_NODE_143_length_17909_cov_34.254969_19_plen_257_part_00